MPPKKQVSMKKPTEEIDDGTHESNMLAELAANPSTETAAVLAAIGEMSQKMDVRFNSLDATLKANQATLDEHETRLSDVEHASSAHDGRLSAVEQQVKRLEDANKALLEKVIDLEARSRRQNIKIVGLPENRNFSKPVEVDRAHRLGSLGSATATAANKPRVMIAKIHSYRVKDSIIKMSMERSPLMYQGHRIHIFPDFPAEIMKRRQLFEDTRRKLKAAGLRTGFIYPARLRVTRGNETSTFNTPEEAKFFADNL
ncbi:hypothetical protein WMY93_017111 [Mugilogobius chulae]|uniref:L1 transposable element RRM domain-containing protein n=1 Tax=Mugilogobius chulae TaxID=88201 RepID=A0AAW0NZH1_9GOBI